MKLAHEIAKYMVETGTKKTLYGNYLFSCSEINRKFGTNLPEDFELYHEIVLTIINGYRHIVSELVTSCEGFDFTFYTAYCPNVEDDQV